MRADVILVKERNDFTINILYTVHYNELSFLEFVKENVNNGSNLDIHTML